MKEIQLSKPKHVNVLSVERQLIASIDLHRSVATIMINNNINNIRKTSIMILALVSVLTKETYTTTYSIRVNTEVTDAIDLLEKAMVSGTFNFSLTQSMTSFTVTAIYTNAIQLQYSSDGGFVKYTLLVNNIENGDFACANGPTCLLTGLTADTQYNFDICVSSDWSSPCGTPHMQAQARTYKDVSDPLVVVSAVSGVGMTLSWSTTGGVPTPATVYNIKANGMDIALGLTTTTYTINTLTPGTTYPILVQAQNDDDIKNTTTIVTTYGTPPVTLTAPVKTTKTITLNFESIGGVFGSVTTYSLFIGTAPVSQCTAITSNTCYIQGLVSGSSYTFKIESTNAGQQMVNGLTVSTYASINGVTVALVNRTTTSIAVQTKHLGGVPGQSSYLVDLHGSYICSGTSSNICVGRNLQPGTSYKFISTVSNDGDSSTGESSFATFYSLYNLVLTSNQTTTSRIIVIYNTNGGVPDNTFYTTKINGQVYADCINLYLQTCEITNLNSGTQYKIETTATNDIDSVSMTNYISTLAGVKITSIDAAITTKTLSLTFGSINGVVGLTKFSVYVNGSAVPSCTDISETKCDLINLTPGTVYSILVVAQNDGTSDSMTTDFSTYPPVSQPIITFIQHPNKELLIKYSTTGGVPGQSTYTVSINGTNLPGCINIQSTECTYSPYQIGDYFIVAVFATNDGLTQISTTNLKIYDYPTAINIINIVATNSNISIEWTESQEGVPNMTTYQASLSNEEGANFIVFCDNVTNILKCTFPNLIQNTTYSLRVTVLNTYFDPVNTTIKFNTLSDSTDYCKSGNTECNGNGVCSNGQCNCKTGWIGQYCETPIKIDNNHPPIIVPNPESPGVIIDDKGITYSFSIGEIKEIDSASSPIKTLNVSSLQWSLTKNKDINITNPTNVALTERSWQYSTVSSASPYFKSMNVTFYQFLAIPAITQNDYYEYQYAGQTYSIKLGSFKYTLNISEWDFQSRLNTLEISSIISAPIGGSCDPKIDISLVDSGSGNNINIGDNNGNSVFGRLLKVVLLDDIPRSISHKTIENTNNQSVSIVSVIPFFESTLFIDPDFSTLISVDGKVSCSSNSDDKWKIIVGAVVGGVVVIEELTPILETESQTMSTIEASEILTHSIKIAYTSVGGTNVEYSFTVNGSPFISLDCLQATTCLITGLTPNTTYDIVVCCFESGSQCQGNTILLPSITYPTVSNLSIALVNRTSSIITIEYDSLYGVPGQTIYSVDVHGVIRCPPSPNKICIVNNLGYSTLYKFIVNATNDGDSVIAESNFATFYILYGLNIQYNETTTSKIFVVYTASGGVPGQTYYTTIVNDVPYPLCINIQSTGCEIMNLQSGTAYKIEILATNTGENNTVQAQLSTLKPAEISDLNATSITTKTMSLSFGSIYGVIGNSKFTIFLNDTAVPSCTDISTTTCDLTNLTYGTVYSIRVSVLNDGRSNQMTKLFTTYSLVSPPIITTTQFPNKDLLIKYTTTSGVPGQSLYTSAINGTNISGCINTQSLQCTFNPYQIGENYEISVLVSNDGHTEQTFYFLKIYDYPTSVNIINVLPTKSNISIEWTESQEGVPNMTTYQASLSNEEGANFFVFCDNVTNILKCIFPNLIQNTTYSLRVTVLNTDFLPVNTTIKVNTLSDTTDFCKTGNTECNGNGVCSQGLCNCKTGWIGQYCEVPNNVDNNHPPIIVPNPGSPGVIIDDKGITYSFSIGEIKEIDSTSSPIKTLNISSLQWTLSKTLERNVTNQLNLTMNITFYQFIAIPTITQNDYYEYQYAVNTGEINLINIGDNNGNSVFGRLVNRVMLDSIPRSISHRAIENTNNQSVSIVSVIPFFESTLFIDPDFSTLISVDGKVNCSSNKDNKWKIIVGAVVGGFVAISILAGASYYLYRKKKITTENNKIKARLQQMNS
ncbi:hypothetical protein PPL_06796 [Heterostelium album PN500]|uniref:Fibronectin type-III domain-containing protein n=1 Tax=Heterostelium pallidum (strain ATCC 26659 / Pp 5 / PN500) TaxID=670386 RepID=D3BDJ4_HETP5|nr:hypothetical protein PPL_06796 [Heterostelium album PN500]EFA79975.1 hypothetical protein PPL_06796 [Heterostelium album PN500]|eukprot:XP_020432095.1 hypothetical protein PPL_06796 [Heterostelium album PN500]